MYSIPVYCIYAIIKTHSFYIHCDFIQYVWIYYVFFYYSITLLLCYTIYCIWMLMLNITLYLPTTLPYTIYTIYFYQAERSPPGEPSSCSGCWCGGAHRYCALRGTYNAHAYILIYMKYTHYAYIYIYILIYIPCVSTIQHNQYSLWTTTSGAWSGERKHDDSRARTGRQGYLHLLLRCCQIEVVEQGSVAVRKKGCQS